MNEKFILRKWKTNHFIIQSSFRHLRQKASFATFWGESLFLSSECTKLILLKILSRPAGVAATLMRVWANSISSFFIFPSSSCDLQKLKRSQFGGRSGISLMTSFAPPIYYKYSSKNNGIFSFIQSTVTFHSEVVCVLATNFGWS